MSWSASVRVVDEDGNGISGVEIMIFFRLLEGHDSGYTDDDGWAEFSYDAIDDDKQMLCTKLYIDGDPVAEDFWVEDGDTFSFTKPE